MNDFRFAVRQLCKSPGFTSLAIVTLALSIGVNSAIFALINGVVLKPVVPVHPEQVVSVFTARQNATHDYRQFSYNEFRELRDHGKEVFADVAAVQFAVAGIGHEEQMRRSFAFLTSENYFSLMGVRPWRGRFYSAEECQPNANVAVAVASYGFWKRMGARGDFVGSTLQLNGQPYTVIGITPEGFSGASVLVAPDLWLPLGTSSQLGSTIQRAGTPQDLNDAKSYQLNLTVRLRPGLTMATAKSYLPVLAQRVNAIQPDAAEGTRDLQIHTPARLGLSTSPQDEGPIELVGVLMMCMAGAVLLIACLNLANMLLARGTARAKEMAVRLAVGASRWRIIRQLLCEGLLLALCGGVVGLVLSVWCNNLLLHSLENTIVSSISFSFVVQLRPDLTVLVVTFLFCVAATMVFSLGPALKATKSDLVNDLKQQVGEPPRVGSFNRFFAPRHISVMAQIALSLALLFAAGLFFRGALNAAAVNPGFVVAGDLVTEFDFTLVKKTPEEARRILATVAQRAHQLPGVTAVGVGTMLPYGDFTTVRRVMSMRDSMPTGPKGPEPGVTALFTGITPDYFDAIGVKLLRGRQFNQAECDNKDARRVAIIDEELSNKLFANADPIGQHLRFTEAPSDGSPNDMEIVGVVSKHRHDVQNDTPVARLFLPLAQGYTGQTFLHVRLNTTDPRAVRAMIPTTRQMLRQIDPDFPVLNIAPFTELVKKSGGLWLVMLGARMFGVFGGIALVLAIIGVYAVKSYAVASRTREIGIRMALGAQRRDVFALIMRQGALQTGLAVAIGVLISIGAGRLLARLLYNVSPSDPIALIISSLLLAVAALLACFLPARRATCVEPLQALRTE
jgi:putative ABC transport system permease protein